MKSFFFALQHLTRIRLYKGEFDEAAFGKSAIFFPLVGFVLGLLLIIARELYLLVFPVPVVSALLIISMVILTGGIHLDGFMDTCDGMLSGRPRERKLEIMRDSRVGAFGVIWLVCLLLLKYSVFISLPGPIAMGTILLSCVLSRWSMVYLIAFFPYARKEGLGTLYSLHTGKKEFILATLIAALISIIALGWSVLIIWAALFVVIYAVANKVTRELGGLTGDIYGATCEVIELLVYLMAIPAYNILPRIFTSPTHLW